MTPRGAAEQMREAAAGAALLVVCGEDVEKVVRAIRALPLPADEPAEGETPETDEQEMSPEMLIGSGTVVRAGVARSLERRLREREEELKRAREEVMALRDQIRFNPADDPAHG